MRTVDAQQQAWEQEMTSSGVRVLLVDENLPSMSHLAAYLRSLGCLCSFARSLPEACALLLKEKFNLVLSKFVLPGRGSHDLVARLAGGNASLFYSFALEDSCLWIPRVRDGKECWGEPALRPGEFARILKDLTRRVLSNRQQAEVRTAAEPLMKSAPRQTLPPARTSSSRTRRPSAETDSADSAA
jgi:hypothetical protein